MTKPKKTNSKKGGKKTKQSKPRQSEEVAEKDEEEIEEIEKIGETLIPNGHQLNSQEIGLFKGYETSCGHTPEKLLTLARARILALWIGMIPDTGSSTLDMMIRISGATGPSLVASLLLNLATKLEEQSMLKASDVTDIHQWKRLYFTNEEYEEESILNMIEWTRRRIGYVGEFEHEKMLAPKFHTGISLSEQDSLGDDIYDFSEYESIDKFECKSSLKKSDSPSKNFGHSTGVVDNHSEFPKSPHAGANRALSVLVSTDAAFRTWCGINSFMGHPHSEAPQVKKETKRVLFQEIQFLLSPPECCLLLCWLGDDDTRANNTRIDDLTEALEQVEIWSSGILNLISSDLGQHLILINTIVKEAHWIFIRLLIEKKDFVKALKALEALKRCKLSELTDKERQNVANNAKKCRESISDEEKRSIIEEKLKQDTKEEGNKKGRNKSASQSAVSGSGVFQEMAEEDPVSAGEEMENNRKLILEYACSLSQEEFKTALTVPSGSFIFAKESLELEEIIDSLKMGIEELHDMIEDDTAKKRAPLKPSATQCQVNDRLRDSWPCHQTVTELVLGQSRQCKVYECLTCRSQDYGKLHIICESCASLNHSQCGHRIRPLGRTFECDDSTKCSPWCPELTVTREQSMTMETIKPSTTSGFADMVFSVVSTANGEEQVKVELELPLKEQREEYVDKMMKKASFFQGLKICLKQSHEKKDRLIEWTKDWKKSLTEKAAAVEKAEKTVAMCNDIYIEDGGVHSPIDTSNGREFDDDVEMVDMLDNEDCLEAGLMDVKHKSNEMKEIRNDVRRLRAEWKTLDSNVSKDLSDMTIDLWMLRCLYKQYMSSYLASILHYKLKQGRIEWLEEKEVVAARQLEEEADKVARLLQEEELRGQGKQKAGDGGNLAQPGSSKKQSGNKKQKDKNKNRGSGNSRNKEGVKGSVKVQEAEKRALAEEAEEKARLKRREQWLAEQKALSEARELAMALNAEARLAEERLMEEALKLSQAEEALKAEEESIRKKAEEEAVRKAKQEEDHARKKAEEDIRKAKQEEENSRKKAEEEEDTRKAKEEANIRKKTEKKVTKKFKQELIRKKAEEEDATKKAKQDPQEEKIVKKTEASISERDSEITETKPPSNEAVVTDNQLSEAGDEEVEEVGFVVSFGDVSDEELDEKDKEIAEELERAEEYDEEYDEGYDEEYVDPHQGGYSDMPYQSMMMPFMQPMMMANGQMMMSPQMMHNQMGYFVPPPESDPSHQYQPYMYMPQAQMMPNDMMSHQHYHGMSEEAIMSESLHRTLNIGQHRKGKGGKKSIPNKGKGARNGMANKNSRGKPSPYAAAVMKGAIDTLLSLNLASWLNREYAEVLLGRFHCNVQDAADVLGDDNGELQASLFHEMTYGIQPGDGARPKFKSSRRSNKNKGARKPTAAESEST